MTIKLRPFFCFYGGKWRAAPRYPRPEHDVIVEPFAGAAGYATRHHTKQVILVERDPVLVALWRYLIRVPSREILALPDMPLDGTTTRDLPVCEEARYLIGFWLNKGASRPMLSPSMWMRNADGEWASGKAARSSGYWGPKIRTLIAAQVEHIRHWRVVEGSYENAPHVRATWFVDPPYAGAGKYYKFGSKLLDYDALGAWVRTRRGFVIACENVGAEWLPFEPFLATKSNPSKHGKGFSAEAIYLQRRRVKRVRSI